MNWGLIGAFVVGSLFGVVLMAQFAAKGQGDRCEECAVRLLSKKACEECESRSVAFHIGPMTYGRGQLMRINGRDPNLSDLAEKHNAEVE